MSVSEVSGSTSTQSRRVEFVPGAHSIEQVLWKQKDFHCQKDAEAAFMASLAPFHIRDILPGGQISFLSVVVLLLQCPFLVQVVCFVV